MRKFDLICIGNSAASIAAARRAIKYKKTACIVSQATMRNGWINKENIARKLLYCAAQVYSNGASGAEYGIWTEKADKDINRFTFDMKVFKDKVKDHIELSNKLIENECAMLGIKLFKDTAEFINPTNLQLLNTNLSIQGEKILIATNGIPYLPPINGINEAITSLQELNSLPKSLVVIGNDYLGIEAISLMNVFGVKTGICSPPILSDYEPRVVESLIKHMNSKRIEFVTNTDIKSIKKTSKGSIVVRIEEGKVLESEVVMIANGIIPNISDLKVDSAGIQIGKSGEIIVDENNVTSQANVYALGIAAGKHYTDSVNKVAARFLVDRLFGSGNNISKMDYEMIPSVVFTSPPIAKCGLSKSEATKKFSGNNIRSYLREGYQFAHALVANKDPMVIEYVTREVSGKEVIVGVHVLGKHVEELINGLALAIRKEVTKDDLMKMIVIYPTAADEFLNTFY